MRKVHGLLIILLIVFVALLLLPAVGACKNPEKQTSQKAESSKTEKVLHNVQMADLAAKRDFPRFLQAAWSRKTDYGFKAADEQNDVSLAAPIFVYGIDEEIVGKLKKEKDLASAVEPVGEWIYPVQVNNEYRTLFGLRLKNNSEWRGVYLGNPYLAASLQGIRKAWSSKHGDDFKLVSCVQPRSFFFIALHAGKPNLTPVTRVSLGGSLHLAPPADWNSITSAGAVLESLKSFWKSQADINDVPSDSTL